MASPGLEQLLAAHRRGSKPAQTVALPSFVGSSALARAAAGDWPPDDARDPPVRGYERSGQRSSDDEHGGGSGESRETDQDAEGDHRAGAVDIRNGDVLGTRNVVAAPRTGARAVREERRRALAVAAGQCDVRRGECTGDTNAADHDREKESESAHASQIIGREEGEDH